MDWSSCLYDDPETVDVVENVATLNCVPIIFVNVINAVLAFSGVTALIFIIYAGLTLMNSGGDQKKVASAKGTLTYAIIGLVLVLLAFGIVNFIGAVTGVSCFSSFGFTSCA